MNCSLFYSVDPSKQDDHKFVPVLIDEDIVTQHISFPIPISFYKDFLFKCSNDRATELSESILE